MRRRKLISKLLGKPLPSYAKIAVDDLPKASILLFYSGNKLTEAIGNYVYKHKYRLPAFHAALYVGGLDNEIVNVGMRVEMVKLEDEFRSGRRIDAITFSKLTNDQRNLVIFEAKKHLGKFYDVKGFIGFGRKIPVIGKIFDKIHGSNRLPFCSDHVVDSFNAIGKKVSAYDSEKTAPWHLQEYAESTGEGRFYTVWEGKDFEA